jgi:hypothetical protein
MSPTTFDAKRLTAAPVLLNALLSVACAGEYPVIVIRAFEDGLPGVRTANPDVHVSLGSDPERPGEQLLVVEYPPRGDDPAGRDVQCAAESRDWSGGRAIAFHVKPFQAMRVSVSFFDRNGVVYTSWADLQAGVWQPVRLAFDEMRPNPYFQPPGAKLGSALDVSKVDFIAFAPQHPDAGRFAVSTFVVEK